MCRNLDKQVTLLKMHLTSLAVQLALPVMRLLVGKVLLHEKRPRHDELESIYSLLEVFPHRNALSVRVGRFHTVARRALLLCLVACVQLEGDAAGWVGRSTLRDTPRVRVKSAAPRSLHRCTLRSDCAFHCCFTLFLETCLKSYFHLFLRNPE